MYVKLNLQEKNKQENFSASYNKHRLLHLRLNTVTITDYEFSNTSYTKRTSLCNVAKDIKDDDAKHTLNVAYSFILENCYTSMNCSSGRFHKLCSLWNVLQYFCFKKINGECSRGSRWYEELKKTGPQNHYLGRNGFALQLAKIQKL